MDQHLRGVPGQRVSAEDMLFLELQPNREFRVGEIVACDITSTTDGEDSGKAPAGKIYAKVVSVISASSGPGGSTVIGAKGANALEDSGIRRLHVKTGESTVKAMLSTDVYCFKSAREYNSSKAKADPTTPTSPTSAGGSTKSGGVSSLFKFGRSAAATATATAAPVSPAAGNEKGPATSTKMGGVAPAQANGDSGGGGGAGGSNELIEVVSKMLSRAGVPMNLEQQVRIVVVVVVVVVVVFVVVSCLLF
jgi:hypothetical protein